MVTITINETPYSIRSNWNEVIFAAYCDMVKAKGSPISKRLSLYTGIEQDVIDTMRFEQLLLLSDIVAFMDDTDTVSAFAVSYESEMVISNESYFKIERAKQLLKGIDKPITVAAEIVKLYTEKDISELPVTEAIGIASFFLSNCQTSLTDSNG